MEAAGPEIRRRIIEHLANIEKQKRVDMILKGLQKRDDAQKELGKIKPDEEVRYDANGQKISGGVTYSKQQAEALKKAKEQLLKIDKALAAATADVPNYDLLQNLVGGGGGGDKKE